MKATETAERIAVSREERLAWLEGYYKNYDGEPLSDEAWEHVNAICKEDGVTWGPDLVYHVDALLARRERARQL